MPWVDVDCDDYLSCLEEAKENNQKLNCKDCEIKPEKITEEHPHEKRSYNKKPKTKRDDPIDDGLSLIERARLKAPPAQKLQIENEEFELVKLWLSGELTNSQIMFAYKYKGSGAISRMAIVLREMYRLDKLILK